MGSETRIVGQAQDHSSLIERPHINRKLEHTPPDTDKVIRSSEKSSQKLDRNISLVIGGLAGVIGMACGLDPFLAVLGALGAAGVFYIRRRVARAEMGWAKQVFDDIKMDREREKKGK